MRFSVLVLATSVAALSIGGSSAAAPAAKVKPALAGALAPESSNPQPKFGPAPSWVEESKIPPLNPKHADDPLQILLTSSQEYLTPSGLEHFVEYVVQPLNQAGLQAVGNVVVPWNVTKTDLTLNRVTIERDGKMIDALKRDDVSVLRRETKLEQSTLTGLRTVVMPVRGLEVGDKLSVSFTYKTKPGTPGKPEEVQDMVSPIPVARLSRRLVVSSDLPVRWSISPALKNVSTKQSSLGTERVFVVDSVEPEKERKYVPTRFKHSFVQVSSFNNWREVADALSPSFDSARETAEKSEVAALADKIAETEKNPQQRMLAALRIAQDKVRYVALLLGDGDYMPMTADEVWAQRFGDCKGKTAFLLALLDRLGIAAEPMLASVQFDDGLDQRLPSLAIFDHVYVRAHIGNEIYYLDGTNFGQRTLEELREAPTHHGLPLIANSQLVTVPDAHPSAPLVETDLVWDARSSLIEKVPFEAKLILRGSAAAEMRALSATSTDREKFMEKVKNKVNGVANDALELVSSEADAPDGSYVFNFKGSVDLDWTAVSGLKGNRLQFNQSTLSWDGEFDRDDDAGKTIPVSMAFPYWERTVEKVLLPSAGKDFFVDAPAVDQTIALTHISRTVSVAEGAVTSVSDFKRLGRELDPTTARSVKDPLSKIKESYAYIVSKKKLKLSN